MKPYLLYLCTATLLFSCSKADPIPTDEGADGQMHFAANIPAKEDDWGRATRGAVINNANITDFGAFCFHTDLSPWNDVSSVATPNKMSNILVQRAGAGSNDWTYTPAVEWNGGDRSNFTFFGYAPYATADNGITAPVSDAVQGTPSLGFIVGPDVTKQVDLLMAKPIYNTAPVGRVKMQFVHALSSINFKAFSIAPGVTVSKIEISTVKYKGSLTLDGSWSSNADTKNFSLTYATPLALPNDAVTTETAMDLSVDPDGFFLLPQDLTGNTSATITFTFTTGGVELIKEYVIKEVWEQNKRITYTVDLTTNLEAPLEVTKVTITDWAMGTSETGDSDGQMIEYKFKYDDNGTITDEGNRIANTEFPIEKRPASAIQAWNTKADGSGDYYGQGDMITLKGNTTLYAVDNTVIIGGAKWLRGNLSGTAGSDAGHYSEGNPAAYGHFFKWGSTFVYQRESSSSDGGGWGDPTSGTATTPAASSTGGYGYDYVGLAGGTNPGDPCQKLGAGYRTPTHAQWQTLNSLGTLLSTYNGIPGRFFGSNASSCDNSTIQPGCIFLPISGYRSSSDGGQGGLGGFGYYWSSSVNNSDRGGSCYFHSGGSISPDNGSNRGNGFSVRCVSTDVNIAGVNWTTANLEGTAGTATGHKMATEPQSYGNFFKWGSSFVYQRESSTSDGGGWGGLTTGAATTPASSSTGGTGYDYVGLAGGTNPGDPCKQLGANYKTPTRQQWQALKSLGTLWSNYNDIPGLFLGPNASSCNNTTLQDGCIFLPISGYRKHTEGVLVGQNSECDYWSSSVETVDRGYYFFGSLVVGNVVNGYYRGCGFAVRCVRDNI